MRVPQYFKLENNKLVNNDISGSWQGFQTTYLRIKNVQMPIIPGHIFSGQSLQCTSGFDASFNALLMV